MSHGSEGSKGTTRHRYLAWLDKKPRTKTEMAAYQQGAGRVNEKRGTNQSSRKPQNNPKPSNLTQSPAFNYGTNIPPVDIPEKKELLKEKSVVQRAEDGYMNPMREALIMPQIQNLSIINGNERRMLKERKIRREGG